MRSEEILLKDQGDKSMGQRGRNVMKVGREAPRYLLRLPQELRNELQREAGLNGRSVNSEILSRLQLSLSQQARLMKKGYRIEDPARSEYAAMNDTERTLLGVIKKLSPEKQLALISLFK